MDADFPKKLGIKPSHLVCLMGANSAFAQQLHLNCPSSVRIYRAIEETNTPDIVIVWPEASDDLGQLFQRLRNLIQPNGAVWAVIPKKPVALRKGIPIFFDQVQAAALPTGLVDNKTLTFSEEEYGIRFVVRRSEREKVQ